jgi:hypothetical protein
MAGTYNGDLIHPTQYVGTPTSESETEQTIQLNSIQPNLYFPLSRLDRK